jgi:formylglycine-generating enzyme required for sulfatase activity
MTLEGMQFCLVPAGPFWMGDDDKQHQVDIGYDYWIGRYPISNAQFACFVQADGYKIDRYWSEAKAAGVWLDGWVKGFRDDKPREGPVDFGSPFHLPNHPVVGVTWYEMLAYCRWLTERGQAEGWLTNWAVCLPSEAEWEKAARGGLRVPAELRMRKGSEGLAEVNVSLRENDAPKRVFPWGEEIDPNHANYGDSHIGATSAVGCFPQGQSPYGCEEMSGNVWEWTRSLWHKYPCPAKEKDRRRREATFASGPRVLRGGSFDLFARALRCAFRGNDAPVHRSYRVGFRVVLSPFVSESSER